MTRAGLGALLAVAGCGRLGFDSGADLAHDAAGASVDAAARRSYVAEVLADAPHAYYRLGEASGDVAVDSSGHGLDAGYERTLDGVVAYGESGAIAGDDDTAVYLQGLGNADDVNPGSRGNVWLPPEAFAFAGDFTVEAWIQPRGVSPDGWRSALFIWEDYEDRGFRTGVTDAFELELWTSEAGLAMGPTTSQRTGPILQDGAWQHVAFVRTSAAVTIYVDGAAVLSGALDMLLPTPADERGFGAFHGMPSTLAFDEVALYDYALPAARIAAHVAAAAP